MSAVLSVNAINRMCHGKKRYPAEITALIEAQKCAAARKVALRVYQCPVCDGWHMTSQVTNQLKGTSRPGSDARPPLMTTSKEKADVNARTNDVQITEIDTLARQYADAQNDLDALTNALRVKVDQVVREHWQELRRATTRAAERYEALFTLVQESRPVFDKPKTRILHGVRCGYRKSLDSIRVLDSDNTCALIAKHLPDRADVLIATSRKPVMAGLQQLDDKQLKQIGAERVLGGDEAFAALANTDLDKVVQALMKSAIEKAEAA